MSQERDTHFAGFAKSLLGEIQSEYGGFVDVTPAMTQLETLIAQRAYDLMYSAIEFMRYSPNIRPMQISSTEVWIHFIPDMDKWPK